MAPTWSRAPSHWPGRGVAAANLFRKKVGLRYAMNVVPLDPGCVRGTHGRPHTDPEGGPLLLCIDPAPARDRFAAIEIRDLMLGLVGVPAPTGPTPL